MCVFSAVEVDKMPGMDKLWVTTVKEPTPEILAIITTDGCAKLLGHMLQIFPDQVCSHKGFLYYFVFLYTVCKRIHFLGQCCAQSQ